jgi:hypothetical protein
MIGFNVEMCFLIYMIATLNLFMPRDKMPLIPVGIIVIPRDDGDD